MHETTDEGHLRKILRLYVDYYNSLPRVGVLHHRSKDALHEVLTTDSSSAGCNCITRYPECSAPQHRYVYFVPDYSGSFF